MPTPRADARARGRASYDASEWAAAYDALSAADEAKPLAPDDLERLGRAAYMVGRDDDYVAALERAYDAYVAAGSFAPAVRCTWWIGHNRLFRGQGALASGWFARGHRLLEECGEDCVERGYVLIPRWIEEIGRGDTEAGYATCVEGEAIGERFGDDDLMWLARDEQARALVKQGKFDEAMRLVDELLVVASSGRLSPIVTGIVYCNTIAFCHEVFLLRQAAAWTDALTGWCDRQPQMVAHNGTCLVHRAEIMQMRGAWTEALDEARRAAQRFTAGALNQIALGGAYYRQGEVMRLRGDFRSAEDAYREASKHGYDPQPGLSLLRLAEGNTKAAAAAIRRAVAERTHMLERARVLPSYVEIMLATNENERATAACDELAEIAGVYASDALAAMAAHAQGQVALARGDVEVALTHLRAAWRLWNDLGAVHESATVRLGIAAACRAFGDEDTAALELRAAEEVLERLGAPSDSTAAVAGLTERELEVLRLVAAGKSNKEIAAALVLSEHTVRRHLQNIFTKIGVSSRTAASAFAHEHRVV